tara:strand:+ start:217 stop:447 length:231 start_codon:yes stop_codon:yes gene_type:complete
MLGGMMKLNIKEKQLLLECVDHFISWEISQGRDKENYEKKVSFLGVVEKYWASRPLKKMINLDKLKEKITNMKEGK